MSLSSRTARWFALLMAGIALLSMGEAYFMYALSITPVRYPYWLYYLTLEFLPRVVRVGVFLVAGLSLVVLALLRLTRAAAR